MLKKFPALNDLVVLHELKQKMQSSDMSESVRFLPQCHSSTTVAAHHFCCTPCMLEASKCFGCRKSFSSSVFKCKSQYLGWICSQPNCCPFSYQLVIAYGCEPGLHPRWRVQVLSLNIYLNNGACLTQWYLLRSPIDEGTFL